MTVTAMRVLHFPPHHIFNKVLAITASPATSHRSRPAPSSGSEGECCGVEEGGCGIVGMGLRMGTIAVETCAVVAHLATSAGRGCSAPFHLLVASRSSVLPNSGSVQPAVVNVFRTRSRAASFLIGISFLDVRVLWAGSPKERGSPLTRRGRRLPVEAQPRALTCGGESRLGSAC
jgi:hypothetical protein